MPDSAPVILNLIDDCPFPEVFRPLKDVGRVIDLPSEQAVYLKHLPEATAVLTSLRVRTDRAAIESAPLLQVIGTPSTGRDHIDLEAALERGVEIVSLKDDIEFLGRLTATAELAWGLLLSTVRKIPWGFDAAKGGDWARDRFRGTQLSGKTLGIVGLGRLGTMVADYGKAFRMRVLASDPGPRALPTGVENVSFNDLLEQSDVVSIHIHLTEENRGLFSREIFQRMKPGSILINTSRGAILDEEAFLDALHHGPLAGAGVDVIEGEWRTDFSDHPLIDYSRSHDNLVITPHVGGVTHESQRMAMERIVTKLVDRLSRTTETKGEIA